MSRAIRDLRADDDLVFYVDGGLGVVEFGLIGPTLVDSVELGEDGRWLAYEAGSKNIVVSAGRTNILYTVSELGGLQPGGEWTIGDAYTRFSPGDQTLSSSRWVVPAVSGSNEHKLLVWDVQDTNSPTLLGDVDGSGVFAAIGRIQIVDGAVVANGEEQGGGGGWYRFELP